MTLAAFIAVALLHLLAAISPGPAVLMAARTGVSEGLRTGAYLAMGIGAGGVIWAAAALFGLALVFQAAPSLLWTLKIIGGLYLLYMAWGMWRGADQPLDMSRATKTPRSLQLRRSGWACGHSLPTQNPPFCLVPFSSAPCRPAQPFGFMPPCLQPFS